MNDSLLTLYQQTFVEYLLKTLIIGTEMGLKKAKNVPWSLELTPILGAK